MTLHDFYELLNQNGGLIFLSGLGFAAIGAIATRMGKGGQSEEDGRFIGGMVAAFGVAVVALEILALILAWRMRAAAIADTSLALLAAPPVCCAASLYGVSLSFPLRTLGGFERMMSLVGLSGVVLGILWLLSRFHWGVVFFGGLAQLGLIFLVIAVIIRTLLKKAFSTSSRGGESGGTDEES
jgi:hypothetical protein